MTFEEMFEKTSKFLNKAKVSDSSENIAVQFNVTGEGSGVFYAKISDGKMDVQPYDYKDNDVSVSVDANELISALENKKGDTLTFAGNESKIAVLKTILAKIPKASTTSAKFAANKATKKVSETAAKTTKKTTRKKTK
ncbi:MAG: SCP2 sterol-binding domain-containing protein [Firmicutes bacterium]|nr:SCP2 sterol-binding domain-containing protein [Bacillota bacterium]